MPRKGRAKCLDCTNDAKYNYKLTKPMIYCEDHKKEKNGHYQS
jgi:hypothetical protein